MSRQEMDAGQFNQRVRIERAIHIADGQGGFTHTWQLVTEIWARVQSMSGREAMGAESVRSEVAKRMICRTGVAIDASMRCLIGGIVHQIVAIMPYDTKGMYLECRLIEGGEPYDVV